MRPVRWRQRRRREGAAEKVAVEKKAAEKKAAVQAAGKKKAAAEQAVGGAHAIVGWRCRRSKRNACNRIERTLSECKGECIISCGGMYHFMRRNVSFHWEFSIPLCEFEHSSDFCLGGNATRRCVGTTMYAVSRSCPRRAVSTVRQGGSCGGMLKFTERNAQIPSEMIHSSA